MAEKQTLSVSVAAYERVTAVKEKMEAREGRRVTYQEVLDRLVAHWTADLAREAS